MTIALQEGVHPNCHYVPLSDIEGGAINYLLVLRCKLYYQKGKERVYMGPQVKPDDINTRKPCTLCEMHL